MNNTRIRYMETPEGKLISRRRFTTKYGNAVFVELDPQNKKFRVIDATNGSELMTGGNTRNLSVLKIQTKRTLMELGVTFNEETRRTSND